MTIILIELVKYFLVGVFYEEFYLTIEHEKDTFLIIYIQYCDKLTSW